jgi:DNA helicase-2/ATP-dependent DNA helicase PcrA
VGDDDQAIYGWRSADVRNILRFEKHFPGATIVRLEQNYRSSGEILDCANGVISRSIARRPKRLWTDAGPGEMVRVVVLPDEQEEARFVAGEVGRSLTGGRRGSEFAVLYRLNAQSQPLEEAFREAGIRHKVKGGPAFFQRAEVRDVLAWMKVCAVPDDDLSLARIVNAPPRGIGGVAMERLGDWVARQGIAVAAALRAADKAPTRCRTSAGARQPGWRSSPIRSTSTGAGLAQGGSRSPRGRWSRIRISAPGCDGAFCLRRRGPGRRRPST